MKIKILDSGIPPESIKPTTLGSAGIDLRAILDNPVTIYPNQQILIPTGISVAIPKGWVGLISPRSGLGITGLVIGNLTGVIDSDYRGEIVVCLWNRHDVRRFEIQQYERIAQMYLVPHYDYSQIKIVNELDETDRGLGGFGSTGIK